MTPGGETGAGPAVEVRGLTRRFGRRVALDDVTLAAGDGVTVVLGPNGAGKTTLLRVLATALAPDAGEVRLLGLDPRRDLRAIRRALGYVPQDPGLYLNFTVREYLDYIAVLRDIRSRAERSAAVERVLAATELEPAASRRIGRLSGGMRRRVGIAQALLGRPKLIVLDEPFVGLDPEQRLRLRSLLVRLGEEAAVIVSTHQIDDVEQAAREVVVLVAGHVVFQGTPAQLADLAEGRVWLGPSSDPSAFSTPLSPTCSRHLGDPPAGRTAAPATLEDGYLLVAGTEGVDR